MLRSDAAAVMREVLKTANVYVLAHVIDDIGEATVRGALEAGGLVGLSAGQIPPQRVLCCSTLEGKVSIVRQLEPELHIDGHPQTVILKVLAACVAQMHPMSTADPLDRLEVPGKSLPVKHRQCMIGFRTCVSVLQFGTLHEHFRNIVM